MDGELAFAGAGTHPSEAIANLPMSTRGFQLRWGAAREIQEGIAVDPLLVGCGLKTHDLDSPRPLGRKLPVHYFVKRQIVNRQSFPIATALRQHPSAKPSIKTRPH